LKKVIKASASNTNSDQYIKAQLFDWLCEYQLDIDGYPAQDIVKRVKNLKPTYDVDDVIALCYDEGLMFAEALEMLEDELGIVR